MNKITITVSACLIIGVIVFAYHQQKKADENFKPATSFGSLKEQAQDTSMGMGQVPVEAKDAMQAMKTEVTRNFSAKLTSSRLHDYFWFSMRSMLVCLPGSVAQQTG